ncbi:cobalt ECF transporter T component CbiQ [Spirochaetia bacterium]|nr:cobalt ECF transporter T component CbiQ [Spirochaetia bacterium]
MYLDRLEFKNDPLSDKFCFDLRCRVISAFLLIAAAVTISNYYMLALLIVILLFFLIKSIRIVLLRLIPVNIFTLMLWVSLPLGALLTARLEHNTGNINYSDALFDALIFTLRINAAALLYMLFLIPIGISGLGNALSKTGVPKKLVSLLILSYRFIFVMFERVYISVISMKLRQPAGRTMSEQWRSYAAVFAASFLSAEFRSQKIWMAMQSRGFDGTFPITKTFRWKLPDTFLLAASMVFAVCLPLLDRILNKWIF